MLKHPFLANQDNRNKSCAVIAQLIIIRDVLMQFIIYMKAS